MHAHTRSARLQPDGLGRASQEMGLGGGERRTREGGREARVLGLQQLGACKHGPVALVIVPEELAFVDSRRFEWVFVGVPHTLIGCLHWTHPWYSHSVIVTRSIQK